MQSPDHHTTHREVELLETLRAMGGSARNSKLATQLNVSEETVRRIVASLAKTGLVERVHGGVYLANTEAAIPIDARLGKRSAAKVRIAMEAANLVSAGSCVFLDVGSTSAYVAENLVNHRALTVVTNSIRVAEILTGINDNQVFLAGGQMHLAERGVFGSQTIDFIERFNIDTAVMSIDGFDPQSGFLLSGAAEAELARAVCQRAHRTIIVSDFQKFGQTAPHAACDKARVDMLICDSEPGDTHRRFLTDNEIELRIAPPLATT